MYVTCDRENKSCVAYNRDERLVKTKNDNMFGDRKTNIVA